jgi:hypothetical protein
MRDARIPAIQHLASSTHAEAGTRQNAGTLRKETCRACQHTVYIATVDGKDVVTDSELITVVSTSRAPKDKTRRTERIMARRLHAESCETRARQTAREREAKALADWEAKQPAKRSKLAALTIEQLAQLASGLRDAGVAAQAAIRRVEQAVTASAGKKRGARTRGM